MTTQNQSEYQRSELNAPRTTREPAYQPDRSDVAVDQTSMKTGRNVPKWLRWMGVGAAAVFLALGAVACDSESGDEAPGHESSAEVSGGEGTERSEGGSNGEGGESHGGSEGSGLGEAAESGGTAVVLGIADTYDEVRSGARLILSFDANANAFKGTVENTTNGPLARARVEVHLDNGTELGPTTPVDLAPGQILPINLTATGAPFDTWTAHPEVGSGEASEGGSGEHGSAGEGAEGTEGGSEGAEGSASEGAATAAPGTYFSSSGVGRGTSTTQALRADEAYAGNLNGLEFALTYDPSTGTFPGRVKNEAGEGLCDVSIRLIFNGNRINSQSVLIPSLDLSERANFTLSVDTRAFTTWTVETNTHTCDNVPAHGGGAEGGGEVAGGESSTEGGGEGAGHEGGSESGEGAGHEGSGPEGGSESGSEGGEGTASAIDQPTIATINGLDVNFAYDTATQAFRGTMSNNGSTAICVARMEIHVSRGGQTIELGPTVDASLAPGETQKLVLAFDALPTDRYGLHPEVSPCP